MLRRARDGERGQALLELAMTLPVFLFIFWGLADLGRAIYARNAIAAAARDGARIAATAPRDCAAVSRTVREHATLVDVAAVDGVRLTTPGGVQVGQSVTVRVAASFRPTTPPIAAIVGGLALNAQSTMVIEYVPTAGATACV